ncbi:putative (2E,6E)-farnesyl diphosphate synthase [Streptomyces aurantiacus JA 4570]|uniref:Putative (2E,6E)-farnesyl diphosphate synthase n=1 Tax=Streptomyces aurantiacus JA 4570 TaxID=1286094 RepID=S3Z9V1_9ACTN|nr:polyprenyl synthetase family protein [Streptomyces aurantiacus]EPH39364.1 putative (2E,6E)-farnesyl diphosphate synthase [Streptomyces aurantiacus JA 4570]
MTQAADLPAPAARTSPTEPLSGARRLLRAAAVASCVPYLSLKVAWIAGSHVGIPEGSSLLEHRGLMAAANSLTVLMDGAVIVLALLLTRPWGRRVPAWLLGLPMWAATGLLLPIMAGFPAQLAVRALGGDPLSAVRAAAAVELTHNFTLLHDDVMDRDATRRHRPTAWTVFGDADAILAGDTLQALAQRLLAEDPHPGAPAAAARLATCVIELCAGQHADCALESRAPDEVSLAECLAMAEAKTGALLGCACAIGAVYAGAGADTAEALDGFGRQAGLAFQLIDDVIGIWGDPARTGKPARADLAARKKSLPVVAALASGTPEGVELAGLYGRATAEGAQGDLERMARVVERAGGRDWAQLHAADRMSRALGELARAVPDPERAGGLLALAEFVTRRPY